ncbi:MAG: hypothetical protein KGD57_10770 [Candidatus Lokiarchaeota archaeon]|nr:hypothetical protein [Candidatus Lokiarchaeota archaeon]
MKRKNNKLNCSVIKINEDKSIKKFIDYDKKRNKYFNNIYVKKEKIVIKMPFLNKKKKKHTPNDTKYENFSLSNRIFITSY